ncbi:MAG TPA: extracellular solute-binding protein [Stellaceae bacterium]|jgi:ABC-type molybdate transport system substrate-binding protein|nr:extracellular solute-binding protein [Stellaceae bacterium]
MRAIGIKIIAALGIMVAGGLLGATAARADGPHVLAAGSLREVIGAIGDHYAKETGVKITGDFGPSGLLRERIEKGEKTDLFASADMGHPLKLLADGRASRVAMFTRNLLCGVALPKTGLTTANFIDRLLDPKIKLGTSTPKADPSGDYTWAIFHRIDAVHPGAFATLDHKAQKIFGGPANNAPVNGKDPAAAALESGQADIVIGYCSGRKRLQALLADVQFVEVPREVAAGPEYGLAVLKDSDPHTPDLALFMLSPEGQQIFARYGFAPVGLPAPGP